AAVLISERNKAPRDRNVSLLYRKFLVLEFLVEVLTCRFLLCAAVLKTSERSQAIRNWSVSLL
ncbi:hypothetical protein HMPREF9104_00977, partial [Lentilactobacillus kisonensis F0435]